MEVVVFLSMMIVPFISVAALIVSVLTKRRADALKNIVLDSMTWNDKREAEKRITLGEI